MFTLTQVSPMYARCYRSVPQNQSLPVVMTDDVVESCIVKDQTIENGDYSNTRFRRVVFQNCRFINCDFSGAELLETRLIGCDLKGSSFDSSVWSDTIAWLCHGIKIVGAKMSNAVFEDCGISCDNLSNCSVESVEIIQGTL